MYDVTTMSINDDDVEEHLDSMAERGYKLEQVVPLQSTVEGQCATDYVMIIMVWDD